jgi:hypothetical protein
LTYHAWKSRTHLWYVEATLAFPDLTSATGASGIVGWAITNTLIHGYPDESVFSQVTALTNRPLEVGLQWPPCAKLQVVSGLDLLTGKGQEALQLEMKEKVKGIDTVTHVYYCGKRIFLVGISGNAHDKG